MFTYFFFDYNFTVPAKENNVVPKTSTNLMISSF